MTTHTNGSDPFSSSSDLTPRRLGMVVGGSLKAGVDVKLDPAVSVENSEVQVGRYVVIEGQRHRFFGLKAGGTLEPVDHEGGVARLICSADGRLHERSEVARAPW